MAYQFPPDVQQLVREQMANGHYGSEDDVLRHALRTFSELRSRQEEILADVKLGVAQADGGLAKPLNIDALIERCASQLAEEGIGA